MTNKKLFTLVELMVAISISVIILSLSIGSYPKFSRQIGLTSEIYKIISFTKENQSLSKTSIGDSDDSEILHGVVIKKDNNTINSISVTDPKTNNNSDYVNTSSEGNLFNLKNSYNISKICIDVDEINGCTLLTLNNINKVYVFFNKNNSEARIISDESSGLSGPHSKVVILLSDTKDSSFSKKFVILKSGQLYISD